jgi:hypothetical protein
MRTIQRSWVLGITGLLLLLATGCGSDEEGGPSGLIKLESSPDQKAPARAPGSSAERCIEMATQEDWKAALDPCTRAAKDDPDDSAVQQALERALEARDQQEFIE